TLPVLQHDFCALWNELVQEERKQGYLSTPFYILLGIRNLYTALHPSGPYFHATRIPLCNIDNHRPDSSAHVPDPNSRCVSISAHPGDLPDALPHHSTSGSDTVSQQANIIAGPPSQSYPATSSEIGDTSQAPVPEYTPTVLSKSSCGADTATVSNPMLPALSVLGSPPPSMSRLCQMRSSSLS
ncbi:hypothetical protein BJV77DRAFT_1030182, partial [Russula vinacea]